MTLVPEGHVDAVANQHDTLPVVAEPAWWVSLEAPE